VKGKEVVVPPPREPAKIVDIMEALKQSLAIAKKPAASELALEEAPKQEKAPTKKRRAGG
jgi:non-homologous end joining protein Ku